MEVVDYNKLKIFKTVADLKNFSKAAEVLFLTQPTITLQIKKLENYLNVTLFERTKEGIKLTKAGEILYKHAAKILDDYLELEEEISKFSKKLEKSLSIGVSSTIGEYFLPKIFSKFVNSHPDLNASIFVGNSKEVEEGVLSKSFYIGLVEDEINSNKLKTIDFYTDEIIFIASNRMEFPSIINKEDIKDYKFVFREKGSGTRNIVETQLKNANIKIIPDIEISSSKAIISLVANSDYIGFVSKLIAEDLLKRGIIKEVKIDSLRIERKFTCIMQKNTRLPKIERDFLNFLLKESEIL
jgi:DNA-binding transcriptional LysR family regulator